MAFLNFDEKYRREYVRGLSPAIRRMKSFYCYLWNVPVYIAGNGINLEEIQEIVMETRTLYDVKKDVWQVLSCVPGKFLLPIPFYLPFCHTAGRGSRKKFS